MLLPSVRLEGFPSVSLAVVFMYVISSSRARIYINICPKWLLLCWAERLERSPYQGAWVASTYNLKLPSCWISDRICARDSLIPGLYLSFLGLRD